MHLTFTHEHDWGFGWIAAEPPAMERASHALAHEGGVWLVDPVDGDGLHERIAALGEVRGVLQLLDRHARDGAALAARYGVPRIETPVDGLPDTPFETIVLKRSKRWHEVALWWPGPAVLVVTEALGTTPFFAAPGESVGVHALLRLTPPHRLTGIPARHLLVGHGPPREGGDVPEQIARAVTRSRRDMPRLLIGMARAARAARSDRR
jgi:hypothetical protein